MKEWLEFSCRVCDIPASVLPGCVLFAAILLLVHLYFNEFCWDFWLTLAFILRSCGSTSWAIWCVIDYNILVSVNHILCTLLTWGSRVTKAIKILDFLRCWLNSVLRSLCWLALHQTRIYFLLLNQFAHVVPFIDIWDELPAFGLFLFLTPWWCALSLQEELFASYNIMFYLFKFVPIERIHDDFSIGLRRDFLGSFSWL